MAKFSSKGDDLYIDGKKVIKGYESFTGWYWFATDITKKQDTYLSRKVDTIYF